MQVAETSTAPERQHRVYWWKEAIIVGVFYVVYSWTRNQFGSNKIAADGIPDQAFTNAVRVIRCGDGAQPVPRTDRAGMVPAVQVVHPVLEHVVRHDALHRHARRVHPAVRQTARRVPAVAQHARRDDRAGDPRFRLLPVDAAAVARRAVPGPIRRATAARASRRRSDRRVAGDSSTRSPSTADRGRSTPTRWRRSPTSTRRCRACTSAGRHGAPSPSGPC